MIDFDIRQADAGDIDALYKFYASIGHKDTGYFEAVFEKDCVVFISETSQSVIPRHDSGISAPNDMEGKIIGFGLLNFEPKYSLYQKLEIPEIQDVNVYPKFRQQGIATALIESFETLVRDQGINHIGISVGLTKDYGPAQRLYCKLGYMPDGNGITCDREFVDHGQLVTMNDDLCLMMVKSF